MSKGSTEIIIRHVCGAAILACTKCGKVFCPDCDANFSQEDCVLATYGVKKCCRVALIKKAKERVKKEKEKGPMGFVPPKLKVAEITIEECSDGKI